MLVENKIHVNSLNVFHSDFSKKEIAYISPRTFYSLSWRLSGEITVNGKVSSANTLTFVPQGYGYQTQILESGDMIVAQFTLSDEVNGLESEIIAPQQPQRFKQLFSQLLESGDNVKPDDLLVLSVFYRILYEWKAILSAHTRTKHISPRMKQAREYIERAYMDPDLRVSWLAAQAEVSEVYFRREFERCYGCTPGMYIRSVRLNQAKVLLQSGQYNVTDTALACGYDSLSYFSYDFHRLTGMTPSMYMKSFESEGISNE